MHCPVRLSVNTRHKINRISYSVLESHCLNSSAFPGKKKLESQNESTKSEVYYVIIIQPNTWYFQYLFLGAGRKGAAQLKSILERSAVYVSVYFSNAMQRDTKSGTRLQQKRILLLSFGPSALPEIAIVGSIVSINHGVALTKFEVITGFPIELIGRLAAFSDPSKWKGRPTL